MFEIDKERFGAFLLELRKEKGYTQKQLAEKLFVSDKAVSKWERGLSLPDITLLGPLAEILGVTVTELLQAQRISEEKTLTKPEVDALVSGSLRLSAEEQEEKRLKQRKNMIRYLLCMALAGGGNMAFAICRGWERDIFHWFLYHRRTEFFIWGMVFAVCKRDSAGLL